jgi:hypothetical protein
MNLPQNESWTPESAGRVDLTEDMRPKSACGDARPRSRELHPAESIEDLGAEVQRRATGDAIRFWNRTSRLRVPGANLGDRAVLLPFTRP